jgi:hypothetical protein
LSELTSKRLLENYIRAQVGKAIRHQFLTLWRESLSNTRQLHRLLENQTKIIEDLAKEIQKQRKTLKQLEKLLNPTKRRRKQKNKGRLYHMTLKVLCSRCSFPLYTGSLENFNLAQLIEKHSALCPKCQSKLNASPKEIKAKEVKK